MESTHRPDPAQVKVISLGLCRTGTASMREALTILGFGPCYHMYAVLEGDGKDFPTWFKIGDGNATTKDFDDLYHDFHSVVDLPSAMYAAELYAAYPNAKFILTTRDPAKWEKSMRATIMRALDFYHKKANRTEFEERSIKWLSEYFGAYHGGLLESDTQQVLLNHNERVKKIIPPEKLLLYDVSEGWDKLVNFIGVPKPSEPFPHVNDTVAYHMLIFGGLNGISVNERGEVFRDVTRPRHVKYYTYFRSRHLDSK